MIIKRVLLSVRYVSAFCLFFFLLSRPAFAIPEICGNGLDDDGVGGDAACPDPDKDNDGYSTSVDCDDNNYKIFPGIYTASGCPNGQTHFCQGAGGYTACSANVVCEATGSGVCKYIDCANGSDSGNGSFDSPWRSPKMVGTFEDPSLKPSGWYQARPGDVIYFKGSGTCSATYNPGAGKPNVMLYFRTSGSPGNPITIKRYPGSSMVFDPPFALGNPGHIIMIADSSDYKIEDLEMTGSYAATIYLAGTTNVEVSRVKCHDTQGTTNDNVACINAAVPVNHYVHHNELFNVSDPSQPGADNVALIVYFKGGNNRFEYNRLYYTNDPSYGGPVRGRCFKYKHPNTLVSNTVIKGNQFWNCEKNAVQNTASGLRMDHNLVVNTGPNSGGACGYFCGDIGGGSLCADDIVEYNTFVNTQAVCLREAMTGIGSTTFRKNVVLDNAASYGSENGFMRIERYASDAVFSLYNSVGALRASENCYFNPNASLVFDYFGDPAAPTGGMSSFSQWRAAGFDTSSFNENPGLNGVLGATSGNCVNFGWMAGRSGSVSRPNPPTGLSATVVE